jgi:hypothetical protein
MPDKPKTPCAQCKIWLMIDDGGEYVACHEEETLAELYSEQIGSAPANCRTVKLNLSVPLPRGVEVSADLPEDAQPGEAMSLVIL